VALGLLDPGVPGISPVRVAWDILLRLPGATSPVTTDLATNHFQEFTVAAVCDICAKKPGFGNNRPWSRKITKRRFDPNIQRVRAVVNGTPKRLNVCTGCLKAGKVTR
jgi:large subunit ribosomal protein L28